MHDDIIIATKTEDEHYKALEKNIHLVGGTQPHTQRTKMSISLSGHPILGNTFHQRRNQTMSPPQRKEDVPSFFISLLQSHAKFIPIQSLEVVLTGCDNDGQRSHNTNLGIGLVTHSLFAFFNQLSHSFKHICR